MCGEYTDYTQSYHHPGAQFWVGSSRNWSVFLEKPNTGRHEKAPVRCPCSRLAALHGDPRTQDRLTLLMCGSASGDFKVKPLLVYHYDSPRVFKWNNVMKCKFPMMWRSKAWVTT